MSTLLLLDSFDHWGTAMGTRKWNFGNGTILPGRNGNGVELINGLTIGKTLSSEFTILTAGVAYKTSAFNNPIMRFKNIITNIFFDLEHVGDGRLRANFNNNLGPPSTFSMSLGQFYYFEMQASIAATHSGSFTNVTITYEFRQNESTFLSGTLGPFSFVANDALHYNWAEFNLGGPGGSNQAIGDDVYLTDTEFLGDIKIAVLFPNADGDSSAWTPSTAGSHYLMTKEHVPDDDTTYMSSSLVGDEELHNLDNITGFNGAIRGAQALCCVKKSDAGLGAVLGKYRSAGITLNFDTDFFASELSYLYTRDAKRKSPFTGLDWTVAEINALQLGAKRTQ